VELGRDFENATLPESPGGRVTPLSRRARSDIRDRIILAMPVIDRLLITLAASLILAIGFIAVA
jgi:hypothetical protein